jgi:hypothetical protein
MKLRAIIHLPDKSQTNPYSSLPKRKQSCFFSFYSLATTTMKFTVHQGLFAAVTILMLSGCQKQDPNPDCPSGCTTVKGRFVTGNGRAPLRGARLTLVWYKGWGFFGRTGTSTKATATTDANGNYTLNYSLNDEELRTGHLSVDVKAPTYYGVSGVYVPAPRQRDTTVTAPTYWLPRKARLTCQLTNSAALQGNDRISVDISFKPGPARTGFQATIGGFASATQGGVSIFDPEVPAEQLLRIKVLRFRNGSYVPFSATQDSVLLAPHEVRTYPVAF